MEPLIGHERILRELRTLATSSDPPHALLFAGPESTGRTPLAMRYAMMLNCERAASPAPAGAALFDLPPASVSTDDLPCGECRPCRLIAAGTHPDVVTVTPGDTLCRPRPNESSHEKHPASRDIRICQARGMIDLAARYPFEARQRMVVITPADRLARDAANTMLKTLEEPPGNTVFALITAAPEAIIETILSRCRRIDVRTVPRAEIERGLVARGVEPGLAARAAEAGRGKPGLAISYAAKPDLMGDRDRLLQVCAMVAAGRTSERFKHANDLAERWRVDRASVMNHLNLWETFWEQRLAGSAADPAGAAEITAALDAVQQCRADLLAQVQARPALEFMLLSFPRVTLPITNEEPTAANA